ncbi:hypothetical protein AVEN_128834-1 [Araneus ventricosus]|uniref:Uncharacterized protein n=1 Tax=Araneus ventricosus TaxID=182803 RepID=A0A4Y2IFT9_ARAVE|nr:hypothetical protein AVEN_128834-1 [Araneus ventricosus]
MPLLILSIIFSHEWMSADEVTDDGIVQLLNNDNYEFKEQPSEVSEVKMTHKDELDAIEVALKSIKQQKEASSTDVTLFMRCRDISAGKH